MVFLLPPRIHRHSRNICYVLFHQLQIAMKSSVEWLSYSNKTGAIPRFGPAWKISGNPPEAYFDRSSESRLSEYARQILW